MSPGGFWRVYRFEWSVAYVSDGNGEAAAQECRQRFLERYEGSVGVDDWRVVPWSVTDPGRWPWMLELNVPVMKGEYLSRDVAEGVASRVSGVVAREGSPQDKEMIRRGNELMRKVA